MFRLSIGPTNSSSNSKNIDSPTIDDLVIHCKTLLKNNFSKYDLCIKYQEKLRSQLIKANEDYKYLRAWLETANEDCFRMESNDGHLTQVYEILLKNNFVNDFVEYGVGREKLNLKFLSTMIQIKDLRKSLSAVENDIALVKTDYEEMQYREVLLQITPTEESLEFAEFQKNLRSKSVNVMNECDRLGKCLTEACEHIITLKSTHGDLIQRYDVLLQNTTAKEFLNHVNQQETPQLESYKKLDTEQRQHNFSISEKYAANNQSNEISSVKIHSEHTSSNTTINFFSPSVSEIGFSKQKEADSCENVAIYQEKFLAEQRRREEIEKECRSLGEFSDKLCSLLLKYQHLSSNNERTGKFTKNNDSIQNSCVKKNSAPFNTQISEEFPWFSVSEVRASEIKEEFNEKLDLDNDELNLDSKSNSAPSGSNAVDEFSSCVISKTNATAVDEENNVDTDAFKSGYHFLTSCFEKGSYFPVDENKRNSNISLNYHSKSHHDNYDLSTKKFDWATSNEASYAAGDLIGEHYANRIEKLDSIVKNELLSSSDQAEFHQAPISTSTGRNRSQTADRIFYCNKCDRSFELKKNKFKRKCPTCGDRNSTIVSETKSTIDMPTSPMTMSNFAVASSSVINFICDICHSPFTKDWSLSRHKRLVHGSLEKFKCTICGRILSTKHSLTVHEATHSSLKPYKCSICNRCYSHPTLVMMHEWNIHNKKKISSCGSQQLEKKCRKKDFRCDICDRYFAWEESLKDHKRSIHEGHKDYKCSVCGKIFSRIHDRYRHSLLHTSLRPYKCSLCSKSFKDSRCVNQHIRSDHGMDPKTLKKNRQVQIVRNVSKTNLRNIQKFRNTSRKNLRTIQNNGDILTKKPPNIRKIKERRYCCAHCGQRFHQKQIMFHHICMEHFSGMLEHFKCTFCNHVFPTNQQLICHLQVYHHSKKSQNKCSICGVNFKTLSAKVRHEKYFHQDNDFAV